MRDARLLEGQSAGLRVAPSLWAKLVGKEDKQLCLSAGCNPYLGVLMSKTSLVSIFMCLTWETGSSDDGFEIFVISW